MTALRAAATVAGLISFANGFDLVNSNWRRKGLVRRPRPRRRPRTRPLLLPPLASTEGDPVGDAGGASAVPGGDSAFHFKPVTLKRVTGSKGDDSNSRSESVNPSTISFNNKLNRMAKEHGGTAAPRVEALLLDALEDYREAVRKSSGGVDSIVKPNTISFTNAITAWARCKRKDSAERASALLDKMHLLYEDGWDFVRPNRVTYNSVITAWSRNREQGRAARVEDLLHALFAFYNQEGGPEDLKPNGRSFNSAIIAVARSRDKGCADRAKHLLDEMGRLYFEGDEELVPEALTFGAIINAYANSKESGASDKAAQLLLHCESLSSFGFELARPNTFLYNACLNAFAKDPSRNGADKAEAMLRAMELDQGGYNIQPDCVSYSTVINAIAMSNALDSGTRADIVLRRMIGKFLSGDPKCRPNVVAYTATIKAHSAAINATLSLDDSADSNESIAFSARRCEDLLQSLCQLYVQNPGPSLKPTTVTFDLVQTVLTQAGDMDGAERTKSMRKSIENNYRQHTRNPR